MTRICGVADETCFRGIEDIFPSVKEDCECYESCNRLKYDIQVPDVGFNE